MKKNIHASAGVNPISGGQMPRIDRRGRLLTVMAGRRPGPSGRGKPGSRVNRTSLLLGVLSDDARRGAAAGCGEVGRGSEVPVPDGPVHRAGELRSQPPGPHALEAVHRCGDGHFGRVIRKQVHVIVLVVELPQLRAPRTVRIASSHDRSMSASRTPRRYVVTKTTCAWSAETTCLPPRYSSAIVVGRWHAVVSCR
jgi:hypothetical protein